VRSWVAALTASGRLDTSFGQQGWVMVLPQGSYSGTAFVSANGFIQIVGDVTYGGCGGPQLTVLNAAGQIQPDVSQTFAATWTRGFPNPQTAHDFYPRANGALGMVWEISSPCNVEPQ